MNQAFYHFLFLAFFLALPACSDDYDTATHHHSVQSHQYKEAQSPPHTSLQDQYKKSNKENEVGNNRWIWQKPQVVIDKLQPLAGKVVADIGAGPYGYFAFRIAHQSPVEKVLAIDIDAEALQFIEETKSLLDKNISDRIETRLVESHDPMLKEGEADIVLIVNTVPYFEDRVDYFSRLRKGLRKGGKIVIVDFKKRNTPVGPPPSERVALAKVEKELKQSGFKRLEVDDRALEYQYIITAERVE
ncbi:MAG TPA: class I SAM-dependent methyltransferase [Phaeodactylibacter sp.]|nr:class I SAM-dependent methyltransferase [Phaeodactylibacter sp.]